MSDEKNVEDNIDCKNPITSLLIDSKNKNHIVELYSDRSDTNTFAAGFILDVSREDVVIAHITPTGLYDGYMLKKIRDIYREDICGKYEQMLKKLYVSQSQTHKEFISKYKNLTKGFLDFAKSNDYVITIELMDSDYEDVQGYVEEIIDNNVRISKIDSYGQFDGWAVIYINDITFMTCDSDKEHALNMFTK